MFDDFQMNIPGSRRPPCDTLLDVFENIRKDEEEHVKTMQACQEYATTGKPVVSAHFRDMTTKHRQEWKKWGDTINNQVRPC